MKKFLAALMAGAMVLSLAACGGGGGGGGAASSGKNPSGSGTPAPGCVLKTFPVRRTLLSIPNS